MWINRQVTYLRHDAGQRTGAHTDTSQLVHPASNMGAPRWTPGSDVTSVRPCDAAATLTHAADVPGGASGTVDHLLARCRSRARARSGATSPLPDEPDFPDADIMLFSTLSVLLFLNAPRAGGAVRLFGTPAPNGAVPDSLPGTYGATGVPSVDITPKLGRVLVLDHRLYHAHLPATQRRHVLRLNVMGRAQSFGVGEALPASLAPLPFSLSAPLTADAAESDEGDGPSPFPDSDTDTTANSPRNFDAAVAVAKAGPALPPCPPHIHKRDRSVSTCSVASSVSLNSRASPVVMECEGMESISEELVSKRRRPLPPSLPHSKPLSGVMLLGLAQ